MQRAFQPTLQRVDQHRRVAAAPGHKLVEQRTETLRLLKRRDPPAQQERERDPPDLKDICLLIEPGETLALVSDESEVLP